MKLPRDLDGAKLAGMLCSQYGYRRVHQVGSHIVLETDTPVHHRISVPDHHPLRIGTLNAILRSVAKAKGVDKEDILSSL
ncbi:MAG TPA: type II toxin-antitoxin system HicA family toxin [Planctomycetota bacterium]|jgi:predicted RNA binding protein YcfA (HicA-like mRNA interferase family)